MTELMLDNTMAMDRINPYTSTATFGVSYNGGKYKGQPEPTWTEPSDSKATWDSDTEEPEYVDHCGPNQLNKSGSMYLKTGSVYPAQSFLFPARKYQFDDGTTSFSRETVWRNASNYISGLPNQFTGRGGSMWPIILVLLALLFVLVARKKLNV
jgi:hypothetical protein